jgi:AcrR family transcriptional regulator
MMKICSLPLTSKREKTRSAIINAAAGIIADKGLAGTSIDELMSHTGMARGTFYNYFQTREEVLTAVIECVRDQVHKEIEQRIPSNISTEAFIACLTYGFVSYCKEHPCFGRVLVRLSSDIDFFQPPAEDDYRFQKANQAMASLVKRDISFVIAQTYTIGNVDSLLRHYLQQRITIEQAEQMMALTLRGLGVEEAAIDPAIDIARDFAEALRVEYQSASTPSE